MPTCKVCDDEVEELVRIKIGGKNKRMCEDCADLAREEAEIAEESEAAMKDMMGFKGGW
jgi:ribosome-binding protein aMBF1 (putative translation factor)